MAARGRRRSGDAAPAAWSGDADADAEHAPGRAADPVAADIRADDRRVSVERLRAAWFAPLGRGTPWAHLHAVRRLRQLCAGRIAAAHRVCHSGSFWWVVCSLRLPSLAADREEKRMRLCSRERSQARATQTRAANARETNVRVADVRSGLQ